MVAEVSIFFTKVQKTSNINKIQAKIKKILFLFGFLLTFSYLCRLNVQF